MPRAHLTVLLEPMNGPMQFVEVQELVEAPHPAFGDLTRI